MTDLTTAITTGVSEWLVNTHRDGSVPSSSADPRLVHRTLVDYAESPLSEAPAIAAAVGLKRVWVKDESSRFGLPSFKILGASYALYRELRQRLGDDSEWTSFDDWQRAADAAGSVTLVTATEGNHGRAVAHLAKLLQLEAQVIVPAGMAPARIAAIRGEGANVDIVEGTYDDAIAALASFTDERFLVLSDTAWSGYERVPEWVITGYGTIFREVATQLRERGARSPDLVIVQAGVGALAAAATQDWSSEDGSRPSVIAVEPESAACVLAALQEAKPQCLSGPFDSVMAGLNCGLASSVALPYLRRGLTGVVTIADAYARAGVRLLHQNGFHVGPTGAAGVAALLALHASDEKTRATLGFDSAAEALVICTEGITDTVGIATILDD